ncbi:hypothetical protein [Clostridium sp.]|uniref:hypothetical protein n=1 Tax=Clostridium sp. TaxID=1506 RepID=UPI002FCAD830
MKKTRKTLMLVMILFALVVSILPTTALANSAEPPSLVILVNYPPEDLTIECISNDDKKRSSAARVAWEGQYKFYLEKSYYKFKVTTGGESFECNLDVPLKKYNNVVTLDLKSKKFTLGKYPFRSVILVSLRVLLTLLIEGIIFWLFKFRQKRSWLVFFAMNLVTQGLLNIALNNADALTAGYSFIFTLIIGEIFVFAAEFIGFSIFIKEHKKSYTLNYVSTANFISLFLGGYIISVLPV